MTSAGKPPGPKGLPLLGNLVDFGSDVLAFLTESARRYGDVVAMRLGSWPTLLLSNSDDIEKVLVKEHENFVKHSFFWRHVTALFGSGLLTSEGELWHRQRRLAAPAFAGGQLQGYGTAMVCHTERMLENWRDGETRNLHAEMMALTLEIAAKTLFDSEIAEDVSQIDHALNDLTGEIAARFKRPFVVPDFVPLPGHIRYRRAIARIERLIDRLIGERRSAKTAGTDLLSKLMAARDENGQPMSDRQLRDEAITLILAGHETTALALSWTCYLLGRHPDVQAELAAEAGGLLHGRCAIVEDLPSLRFAECVVTEAMRLYPPVWTIGREVVRDCELGGYAVPAGTTILISPWVIHRDPRNFDRPDEFLPGRWADDLHRKLPRFAYCPFGGGPRICIGQRFAMMEAVLILATIVHRFGISLHLERKVTPHPSITLRPKDGVWATLSGRDVQERQSCPDFSRR
jgi:cytochrome P450